MRILVAEDERDMNKLITKKLTLEGYVTDSVFSGDDALYNARVVQYDAILLDIMMPGADGYEVVARLRAEGSSTPVIFLTAKDTVSDRVKGLDLGANDYLVKPFSFEELMARVRAATRKTAGNATNIFTVADLRLDAASRSVTRDGKPISLSAKEFSLLEYLIRNKGRVLTREQIENNVWSFDYDGGTNAVDVYIRYLRKKIDEGHAVKLIYTVRGTGYVLREGGDV